MLPRPSLNSLEETQESVPPAFEMQIPLQRRPVGMWAPQPGEGAHVPCGDVAKAAISRVVSLPQPGMQGWGVESELGGERGTCAVGEGLAHCEGGQSADPYR